MFGSGESESNPGALPRLQGLLATDACRKCSSYMFICLMSLNVLSNIITCFIRVLDARSGPTEGPPCVLFLNEPYTGLIKVQLPACK
jgi:hypothetical protein